MEYWNLIGGTAATFTALAFIMLSFQKEGKYSFSESFTARLEVDEVLIYKSIICNLLFFLIPFCTSLAILSSINLVNGSLICSLTILGIFVLNLIYMSHILFHNKIITLMVLLLCDCFVLFIIIFLLVFTNFGIFLQIYSILSLIVAFIVLFVLLFNFKTHLVKIKVTDEFLVDIQNQSTIIEIGIDEFKEKVNKFYKIFKVRYRNREITNVQSKKKSRIKDLETEIAKINFDWIAKEEYLRNMKGKSINKKELMEISTFIKITIDKLYQYNESEFDFLDGM
ncbi:MAG: hypothetical protein J0M18_02145 [Ignavibacteria bacterium]|nr:hypothetical protein [Ignavibacteria bacterium]